ncbi:MAG: hypothetical protein NTV34_08455, partial [Proteobacteria bacterium]|nr:hypothetical protein [Pseudomonadota bacterium]
CDFREAGLIPKVSQEVRDNLHLLEDYMLQDKKNSSGEDVNWVLLIKPGKFAQTIDKDSQKTWTIPLKTGFDLETVRSILR